MGVGGWELGGLRKVFGVNLGQEHLHRGDDEHERKDEQHGLEAADDGDA